MFDTGMNEATDEAVSTGGIVAVSPSATLLARGRELMAAVAAAEFELLEVLSEIDVLGASDTVEGLATSQWLSREGRCSMPTARKRVRVARTMRSKLPGDAAGLVRDGVVGADHVAVLERLSNGRIADEWFERAPEHLEAAIGSTFDAWEADMQNAARLLDQDGGHDPANDLDENRLRVSQSDEFTLLNGQLVGEYAVVVRQAIEAEAQRLYRSFWEDHTAHGAHMPGWPTLRALALAALVRRGALVDDDGVLKPGAVEATLVVQQHADDVRVFDEGGRLLDDTAVSRLLCDSSLVPVVLDALGKPIDVGDRFRLATSHQRRALKARDGGCCMPGCDAKVAIAQAHHIVPFPKTKCTDLDNLMNLCPRHHGVVHRTGWSAELTPDGWTVFTRPDGTRFWGQRRGRQRTGPVPPPGGWPQSAPPGT